MSGQVQTETKNKAKKDASEITFGGGRPKFGRAKKQQFADFKEGIDDIDETGNVVKSKKNEAAATKANAQDNFINLGSGGLGARNKDEETKNTFGKSSGVRPTFKGRLNLNKGEPSEDQTNQAGNKTYDFKVSYASKNDKPSDEIKGKDKRNTGNRGVPFGQENKKDNDDDFTFVSTNKRVRNKGPKNNDSESDGE